MNIRLSFFCSWNMCSGLYRVILPKTVSLSDIWWCMSTVLFLFQTKMQCFYGMPIWFKKQVSRSIEPNTYSPVLSFEDKQSLHLQFPSHMQSNNIVKWNIPLNRFCQTLTQEHLLQNTLKEKHNFWNILKILKNISFVFELK